MKLFKRSVESRQFKREIASFYKKKVKPVLLSIKHFFKSSHKFFMNHPRLRTASIIGGIFLFLVISSAVMNTFSRKYLNSNIDGTQYDEVDDMFWQKMDFNGAYTRPVLELAYDSTASGSETCADASNCTLAGAGKIDDPYLISNVQEFMYVRSLGYTNTLGKYYKLQNNLDLTGVTLNSYVGNNQGGSHFYDGFFGGVFDGNFKHIKGLSLSLGNEGTLTSNGLFPGIKGSDTIPAYVKNIIIDDVSYSVSGTYSNFRTIGALTGYIDNYAYVFNSGILSGDINVGTTTGASSDNYGVYIGGLIGYHANNDNIGNGYSDSTTFINGIVNVYSYADFHLSGSESGRVYIGGILGFRGNNTRYSYMNAGNSLFYNIAYYGKMNKANGTSHTYQYVYNCGSYKVSSSTSPMNAYYWYKGDNVDINTTGTADGSSTYSAQNRAIAQDANYLQSEGFVANLNSSQKVLRFYFHDVWYDKDPINPSRRLNDTNGNYDHYDFPTAEEKEALDLAAADETESQDEVAERLYEAAYKDVEWYISNDDIGSVTPYFPILRERTENNVSSSNVKGTVTIRLNAGVNNNVGTNKTYTVNITDQDVHVGDFVYHKIKLPYAIDVYGKENISYIPGNSQYTRTFNGWKLTGVSGVYGTQTTNTPLSVMGYQYTLRDTAQAYTKNIGEVFTEGGYYLVPDGVTTITFDSIWAYTVYVRDNKNQMAFNASDYTVSSGTSGYNGDVRNPDGRTVGLTPRVPFTDMNAAYDYVSSHFPHANNYDSIIMLVGNYHFSPHQGNGDYCTSGSDCNWYRNNTSVPVTIKSADFDHDLKPDYSLYIRNPEKMTFGSVRFDFINILGIPQVAGYPGMLNAWFLTDGANFEVSETVVTDHINLFMQNAGYVKVLGGYWNIYNNYNTDTKMGDSYAIFGGNARADEVIATSLYDETKSVGNAPQEDGRIMNIVGGRIKFLSYDNKPMLVYFMQTRMYIDGGYIDDYYTYYKGSTQSRAFTVINGSIINNCYGGGFADSSAIEKGANFKIKNSRIGTLFGGPKYGVIGGLLDLTVENSELDYVYGGGYGGTEYFTDNLSTQTGYNNSGYRFTNMTYWGQTENVKGLGKKSLWVHPLNNNVNFPIVNYHNEYYSSNNSAHQITVDTLAYFSLSKVNGVTFNISNSKVNNNIYGGGLQGFTNGVIRFNLYNVEVKGNIYGAGKSSATDKVKVSESTSDRDEPSFINYAIDAKSPEGPTVDYEWTNESLLNGADVSYDRKLMYTPNEIASGVTTASDVYVNLSGDKTGKYRMIVDGNVYGGGDEAEVNVTNEIHLNINDGVRIKGNVYGGGRKKTVNGNTTVIVENTDPNNLTIIGNDEEEDDSLAGGVYASGEESGVSGNAVVVISGNPVIRNVYGGGLNASSNNTYVYIEGGNIKNVFGGSNTSGTVNNSNIFVGKKSPKQKDTGFVENVDLCTEQIFNFAGSHASNNNMLYHYDISNWSDATFTEWTFKVEVSDSVKSFLDYHQQHDGNNFKVSWDSQTKATYADGIVTITHQTTNTGNGYQDNVSLNSMGTVSSGLAYNYVNPPFNDFGIKSVTFSGTDSSGNSYEMKNCAGSMVTNVPRPKDNRGRDKPKSIASTTYKTNTNLGNVKVDYIYGGNNKGGRTIDTNILIMKATGSNTVEVGDVYGGGNETQTGPDVINGPNIDTYNHNRQGYESFDSQGFRFVPEHKARIVVYGGHVTGSVYGGGRGNEKLSADEDLSLMTATPFVLVTNNGQVDGSVFGGGYATNAPLGRIVGDKKANKYSTASTLIKPMVFIDWGTVNGNVYGGGYGDVVNGGTIVYATLFNPYGVKQYVQDWYFKMHDNTSPFYGLTTIEDAGVTHQSVHIKGSIFGGGERGAKEGGYDYLFESVIDGTTVYLQEDKNICTLDVDGDVFGSGNFSSSAGYSDILILNIGEFSSPKKMKSIQRAEHVYINGSYIQLSGGTDVTNKFNKTKYSFSRVQNLHVGDNTTLFLEAQANMLENYWSYKAWTSMKDNGWTFLNNDGNFYRDLIRVSYVAQDCPWWNSNCNPPRTISADGETKDVITKYNSEATYARNKNDQDERMNRIYLMNDKGLNILPTEDIALEFGMVHGMSFFGIFEKDANGNPDVSYYHRDQDRKNGSVSGFSKRNMNAYILGAHTSNYKEDGFVTNTYVGNNNNGQVYTTIVKPTPENQAYYYWTIGNPIIAQEVNLTASKYIRSGMKGVTLYNFDSETYNRVIFDIADIDVGGLKTEANFITPSAVPTLSENDDDALKTFGLSIETSDAGWVNEGYTYFESDYNGGDRSGEILGTIRYESSGSADFPTLVFNLENSRNIKSNVDLGYVVITINAHAFSRADPLNSLNSTFKIRVNMDTYYYADNEYESSMAPGKHYKSFLSAVTNITSNSEFSTYFNMYARGIDLYKYYKDEFYANKDDVTFDHALYSTYVLPVGTRITMLDISTNDPKYYYYIVDGTETLGTEEHKKVSGEYTTVYTYPISWFKSMDSMTDADRYDEAANHDRYIITEGDSISTVEQFIFTVDFKDVTQHTKPISQILNEEFFLGLRATTGGVSKKQAYPMYETLQDMHFSLYDSSDVNFNLNLYDTPDDDDTIYVDDTFTFDANVVVSDLTVKVDGKDKVVRNTNYYQDRLGLRIGLYHITEDENGNEKATLVSGDELSGAVFYIDGVGYAPGANGFIRLKMADFVVSVDKEVKVDLTNAEHLTSGLYEFRVTAFASADGLYAKQGDHITNSNKSFRVNLVNEHYGLLATIDDDKDVIVYSDGKTSGGNDTIETTVNYFGSYQNPNIKISLKRRNYTTVSSYEYNDVNFADYFDVSLTSFSDTSQLERTDLFDSSTMTIKKDALLNHLTSGDMGIYRLTFKLKPGVDLPTGTYRIMYNLYNGNKVVGDVYTYIIIKD